MKPMPSQEYLREWLDYDPDTGAFRWLKQPGTCRPLVGRIAGTITKRGYVALKPGNGHPVYPAHRLAWVWVHGSLPDGMYIDHIDGNPSNNAIANLRLATDQQNHQNRKNQAGTMTGLKGVKYETSPSARTKNKWRSQINVNGKRINLGSHPNAEAAHKAYCDAAKKYFGEFARFD